MRVEKILFLVMPGFGGKVLEEYLSGKNTIDNNIAVAITGDYKEKNIIKRTLNTIAAFYRGYVSEKNEYYRYRDTVLATSHLKKILKNSGIKPLYVNTDKQVADLIRKERPSLIFTVTSRIIYSRKTISLAESKWFNVHPGILPDYAGSSPVFYMYRDGIAGITIHRMIDTLDAGDIVDCISFTKNLGNNVAELLFDKLSSLASQRISHVIKMMIENSIEGRTQDRNKLKYYNNKTLSNDRILNWSNSSEHLIRWVNSLNPILSAYIKTPDGEKIPVLGAEQGACNQGDEIPGQILSVGSGKICVKTQDGAIEVKIGRLHGLVSGVLLP